MAWKDDDVKLYLCEECEKHFTFDKICSDGFRMFCKPCMQKLEQGVTE